MNRVLFFSMKEFYALKVQCIEYDVLRFCGFPIYTREVPMIQIVSAKQKCIMNSLKLEMNCTALVILFLEIQPMQYNLFYLTMTILIQEALRMIITS